MLPKWVITKITNMSISKQKNQSWNKASSQTTKQTIKIMTSMANGVVADNTNGEIGFCLTNHSLSCGDFFSEISTLLQP